MSNRLFFAVALVLMGVLSGCNTSVPVKSEEEVKKEKVIAEEKAKDDYIRGFLSCSEQKSPPSKNAVDTVNQIHTDTLALYGKDVEPYKLAIGQSCSLLSEAYKHCGNWNRCTMGYVYSVMQIDDNASYQSMSKRIIVDKNFHEFSQREAERRLIQQRFAEQQAIAERKKQNEIEGKRRAHIEQLANNETKLNADIYWYTGQINERKLKLTKVQQGSKEYAELVKELDHLNNELIPLNLASDLIKQRQQEAVNSRLDQQRQAQQTQLDYQRKQLELQRQQAEALEEANNPLSIQNQLRSLQNMNNRNKPVNCSTVGGVTTCF